MTQPCRADDGWLVNPDEPLWFTFDGRRLQGYAGDTLASALLANGVRVVGRSFKYHRPRGIMSAGVEEPNALVEVGPPGNHAPNIRATEQPLYAGLEARSQNCWPSVRWDLGAAAGLLAPMLGAGFYYKTFMAPRRGWPFYERILRRMAGFGRSPRHACGERHDTRHIHCDLLIIGAGPAGLAAACAAARSGARVILADAGQTPGGSLLESSARVAGLPAYRWAEQAVADLSAMEHVRVLARTRAVARFRHGRFDLLRASTTGSVRYAVRARRSVLAAGAVERPLLFADNDRPGIMLAGAVRRYIRCYGVVPGRRAVIVTNNDSTWQTVEALLEAGVDVAAVADVRDAPPTRCPGGVPVLAGARIAGVRGRHRVRGVTVHTGGERHRIRCDLLCVSGGWTPTMHLYMHDGAKARFDANRGAPVPDGAQGAGGLYRAGACNGTPGLAGALEEGERVAVQALEDTGLAPPGGDRVSTVEPADGGEAVHAPRDFDAGLRAGRCFVDLQNDVTVRDIEQALAEGYRSIEHVKRYTTLGMGTDQGRTSNVNGMRLVADRLGLTVEEVGHTTFRPPYTPVPLAALAGREAEARLAPLRRSPLHAIHQRDGAEFIPAGLWLRPRYYRSHGTDVVAAAKAEAANVRGNVGMADVSTLGKIEVSGRDAAAFLDCIYMNRCSSLRVGRARYGVMLREDGCVFDDGTITRLGEGHFLLSTTTANAAAVLAHLEFQHQVVRPQMIVRIVPVSDQWAMIALAGPRSRELLSGVFHPLDVSNSALPFMAVLETRLEGVPVRLFRLSFSGELAYEIAVPADHGSALWDRLLQSGRPLGICSYGLEAMDYMRIEKGHLLIGLEIDGRVTPMDLGLERMIRRDGDYVGVRSLERPGFTDPQRPRLAGFVAVDGRQPIPAGAQLLDGTGSGGPGASCGRITSPGYSTVLDRHVALGFIAGVPEEGTVRACSPVTGQDVAVRVTAPVFHDPKGERMRG